MSEQRLAGKRVLLTQASDFMGPATLEVFAEHGAEIIADDSDLTQPGAVEAVVREAGHIDVLVANLAAPNGGGTLAVDMDDERWERMFDVMVHPLHRLCRAVLPPMYARRAGKIVVYGSATGLKPKSTVSAYSAARSAQVGYVKAVGQEAARHNVQINLIAQNFVENP
ncbi:MAG: SDR family NAD(P)-dependent oxidoreductase, partial [Halioglobus sp.]|nr:SDR family NAD(P)-dependent oxidoreductase [Halioglobus sp.]